MIGFMDTKNQAEYIIYHSILTKAREKQFY